jgi:hypothetical protein
MVLKAISSWTPRLAPDDEGVADNLTAIIPNRYKASPSAVRLFPKYILYSLYPHAFGLFIVHEG